MGAKSFRTVLVALALLAALGGATLARSAHAASTSTSTSIASTGALRICSTCAQTGGDLARYGYVILNSWDAPLIPGIKAANPGVKVLEYKNLSFSVDTACSVGVDSQWLPAGVGYCDSNSNHPDWFLRDTSGNRIASAYFTSAWMMDVGNPAYQARWLANVTADAKAHGWDGVFADDTNADMSWHLNGRTIAKYPSTAAWQAATRSMLATVGPGLAAQGLLFIPNLSAPWLPSYDAQALWADWLQFTSGAAQEYYSKWGSDSSSWFTGSDWTFRQQFQTITEKAGKIFLGLTYAPRSDTRSMTYARANFLLNTTGGKSALLFEPSDPEGSDPYSSSWTTDVGDPAGARQQVGGAWRRDYTGGEVVVNPSTTTQTVSLGGSYIDSTGAAVTSVTLGSATGAVLRSADTTPPPPPAPTPPPPPTPTPPPVVVPGKITLSAVSHGNDSVSLTWTGTTGARVNLFHSDWWFATTDNDGSATESTSKANTGTYRVCLVDGSKCSDAVKIVRG